MHELQNIYLMLTATAILPPAVLGANINTYLDLLKETDRDLRGENDLYLRGEIDLDLR